ncbi:MAG: hypothetical protein H6742_15890 [Alphaproteobacteria bacterium]|nr:hypothetical protein [Alphaproteobacteria bacterium]
MVVLLLSLSLLGCSSGQIALDGDGDGDGGSDAGSDSGTAGTDGGDTDTDADTDGGDTDTDADTDTDGGTEPDPVVRDGSYVGSFQITGTVADYPDYGDVCMGEVVFEVAADQDPEIVGVATCEFQGYLNWFGPQELELTGASLTDPSAGGDVYYDLEGTIFEAEWDGSYQGEGSGSVLAGDFTGDTVFDLWGYSMNISFDGDFQAIFEE